MRKMYSSFLLIAVPLALSLHVAAQDTRNVVEPHIPQSCIMLDAALAAPNGVLPASAEKTLDTERIQHAMDTCAKGKAVVLRAKGNKNVFLSGPLTLRPGVTLVVDKMTVLAASSNPHLYDLAPGACGIVAEKGHGCKPFFSGDHIEGSGIMGEGAVDARGGAKLVGQDETWWDLAHEAKVRDLQQSVPAMMQLRHADGFTLYKITLRNSPGFHVSINQTDGFTAWGVKIMTPKTARNTDGIDPGSSSNITIAYSYINTGDDDVCLKPQPGHGVSHMSVLHNHFYAGHGMSIGSGTDGGADHLLVDDLTIDGADNGLRIKSDPSRGGLVHDITYRNVCIRNVRNPLVLTPHYTTFKGNKLPIYRDISLESVRVLTPGAFTFQGLDADHKLGIKLSNVFVDDQQHSLFYNQDADVTIGPGVGNLVPSGTDVNVTRAEGSTEGKPLECDARFVLYPSLPTAPEIAGKVPPEDNNLYIAADGTGDFYSIQRALDVAKEGQVLMVSPGEYREVLTVDKKNITIRSNNPDPSKTVIVFNKHAKTDGGTSHTATVNVDADNFFAENITIQNEYQPPSVPYPQGSQAVALRVTGDRAVFHNVRLLGNQDTLYANGRGCEQGEKNCRPARQFFTNCYIEGNIDFIFGDGKTVFENCEIHSTAYPGGFLTAQSKHYAGEDSGYVFDHCKLTQDAGVQGNVFLGRPWRDYSTVIFMHTEMGDKIDPAGWSEWHAEVSRTLDTSYYAEFDSTGPGAHQGERDKHTHLLTPDEAKQYDPAVFLRGSDNWNPLELPKPVEQ
jgi:Pectin methylesterase